MQLASPKHNMAATSVTMFRMGFIAFRKLL